MTVLLDCPVKGCTRGRKPQHLMCLQHWRRVPRILQHAVWDTFARFGRSRAGHDVAEFKDARRQYEKATADAIAAVEAKETAEGGDTR